MNSLIKNINLLSKGSQYLFRNISLLAVLLLILIVIFEKTGKKEWNKPGKVIQSDAIGYYEYLPLIFIYKDISMEFIEQDKIPEEYIFFKDISPTGKRMIRYTMGQAVLYSPFFFLGHLTALLTDYKPSGFTAPYKFFLSFSIIVYFLLGLLALRKLLCKYFGEIPTAITLIIIGLGTNLFNYVTNESTMTHGYSFALISMFLLYTYRWHENPARKNSILIGILTGLITLVRPFNILIVLFFILYDIKDLRKINQKARFFINNTSQILLMILVVFILWIPQLIYWKYATGSFLYYTYADSGGSFFFKHPHILEGFLSFRKGIFLYNPALVFLIPGFFCIKKYHTRAFFALLIFIPVFIYFLFSWWSWWYGGGLSIRTFVDIYAFLAIPLAAFITRIIKLKSILIRTAVLTVLAAFLAQGYFFNWQYKRGIIHWSDMTKEAYWYMMWKKKVGPEYWEMLCQMDSGLASKGIYICCPRYGKYKNMPQEEKPCKEIQDISRHSNK